MSLSLCLPRSSVLPGVFKIWCTNHLYLLQPSTPSLVCPAYLLLELTSPVAAVLYYFYIILIIIIVSTEIRSDSRARESFSRTAGREQFTGVSSAAGLWRF